MIWHVYHLIRMAPQISPASLCWMANHERLRRSVVPRISAKVGLPLRIHSWLTTATGLPALPCSIWPRRPASTWQMLRSRPLVAAHNGVTQKPHIRLSPTHCPCMTVPLFLPQLNLTPRCVTRRAIAAHTNPKRAVAFVPNRRPAPGVLHLQDRRPARQRRRHRQRRLRLRAGHLNGRGGRRHGGVQWPGPLAAARKPRGAGATGAAAVPGHPQRSGGRAGRRHRGSGRAQRRRALQPRAPARAGAQLPLQALPGGAAAAAGAPRICSTPLCGGGGPSPVIRHTGPPPPTFINWK